MSKRDRRFAVTAWQNNETYLRYYKQLKQLALSSFEWLNLPPSVDELCMETYLYERGMVVAFEDDSLSENERKLVLPVSANGPLNLYNVPTERIAWANNGYNIELNEKNSVIIYNNYLREPSCATIQQFAYKLYNLDRAIDININAQKTPLLIRCDETQRLTILNLYKEYDGNEPVIKGTKGLNPNDLTVFKTDAPLVAPPLQELKTQIFNEALTYLGISNVSYQKRERLISDEVNRQMGGTIANRFSRLEMRQRACREINAMFGWGINVKFREDYSSENNDIEGGEEDE